MASGTDVINQLRWQIDQVDTDLHRNADAIEAQDRQITAVAAQEMAQWPEILRTQLRENEKGLPEGMKQILAKRELLLAGARTAAESDTVKIKKMEDDLDFQIEQMEAIEKELTTAEEASTATLESDPFSEKIRSDLKQRAADLAEIEIKVATAGVFHQALKTSLKSNVLLRHLDARGFGTESYSAGFFGRIEEKMARAAGFYTILGHIASSETLLAILHEALRERQGWRDAAMKVAERHTEAHFREANVVRRRLAEQAERVDAIERDIEKAAARRQEALETVTRISEEDAAGSIPSIIALFEGMDLTDVEALSKQTDGEADDIALLSIRIARDAISLHRAELEDLKSKRNILRKQRAGIEAAINTVRQNSWHSDRSRFDSAKADRLVRDIATGVATINMFENEMRNARRAPPPPVDTSWSRPSGFSTGSSSSSSTFSTGGGISSGGGFKTGGGF